MGSCALTAVNRIKLRQVLNIAAKYDVPIMLALGYPDQSSLIEVAIDSIERWVDKGGIRYIPKRKLQDIVHRNKLYF